MISATDIASTVRADTQRVVHVSENTRFLWSSVDTLKLKTTILEYESHTLV